MSRSARAASASACSAMTVMNARSRSFLDAMRSRHARVNSTGESAFCSMSVAASRRLPGVVGIVCGGEMGRGGVAELDVGVAQGLQRARQRLQQRHQRRQPARLRVGDRLCQPGGEIGGHQNVRLPRTLIGIMCTLCVTGAENWLMTYLKETSTPNGPDETPPPPSAK